MNGQYDNNVCKQIAMLYYYGGSFNVIKKNAFSDTTPQDTKEKQNPVFNSQLTSISTAKSLHYRRLVARKHLLQECKLGDEKNPSDHDDNISCYLDSSASLSVRHDGR